jgi:hypothetical protein
MRLHMFGFYFVGPLPPYFPLTLKSMAANPEVSWTLFTDQATPATPPNVLVERYSFEEFRLLIERAFDFPMVIPRPYKVADVRPAFGHLFADRIRDADFWGYFDLDVIFGRISHFFTDEVAANFDKLLQRGAFCAFRNTPEVREWFLQEGHGQTFREAMTNPAIQYWDEWTGINRIVDGLGAKTWMGEWNDGKSVTFDIAANHYWPRANYAETKRPVFYYENDRLFEESVADQRREGLYMHLQKRPMRTLSPALLEENRVYIRGDRFSAKRMPRYWLTDALGFLRFWGARLDKSARQ